VRKMLVRKEKWVEECRIKESDESYQIKT